MSIDHQRKNLEEALRNWVQLAPSARKTLVQELGAMAIEAAESDREFAAGCNVAANLLSLLKAEQDAATIAELQNG